MHLFDTEVGVLASVPIVGSTIPLGVGAALAFQRQKVARVSMAFLGDAATEEGVFHESMNFAKLKEVPIIFICENNYYAARSHQRDRQPSANICERARSYGIPAERIEDNDTLKIYELAKQAVDQMRAGESGPRFLECMTYRWKEHVGPGDDFHLGYRTPEERAPWVAQDQLKRLGALVGNEIRQEIERTVDEEIRAAFQFAELSDFPEPDELYHHVFREL